MDAVTPSGVHPALRTDHGLHALAGFMSAGGGYAAGIAVGAGDGERLAAAGASAAAAALAKEAFDAWAQRERASGSDLLASAIGGGVFVLIAALAGS